jgi:hypothetical protein
MDLFLSGSSSSGKICGQKERTKLYPRINHLLGFEINKNVIHGNSKEFY